MVEDSQIYKGSKFRGDINGEILEIVGNDLSIYGILYITIKDSKGEKHQTSKERFKYLLLTHINDDK